MANDWVGSHDDGRCRPRLVDRARGHRTGSWLVVGGVCATLVAANLVAHFAPAPVRYLAVAVAAGALVAVTAALGLGFTDLGLTPAQLRAGVPYAAGAVAVVVVIVSIGVAIPGLRQFFLTSRYDDVSGALLAGLVIIPLQTVIPEELAFRGVLQGTLCRLYTTRTALIAGSIAFGLWHVASSWGLTAGNEGLADVLGAGPTGHFLGIVAAVVATGAAGFVFGWLRWRSDSLLAPIAAHWALNATGAVGAALAWQLS